MEQPDDPLAAARARGAEARQRLVERAGGLLTAAAVAERLGMRVEAVEHRRTTGALLAIPLEGGTWGYPGCQFVEGGLVPELSRALSALPLKSPWTRLQFLVRPAAELGGRTPLEALQAGDVDAVLDLTYSYRGQGGGPAE